MLNENQKNFDLKQHQDEIDLAKNRVNTNQNRDIEFYPIDLSKTIDDDSTSKEKKGCIFEGVFNTVILLDDDENDGTEKVEIQVKFRKDQKYFMPLVVGNAMYLTGKDIWQYLEFRCVARPNKKRVRLAMGMNFKYDKNGGFVFKNGANDLKSHGLLIPLPADEIVLISNDLTEGFLTRSDSMENRSGAIGGGTILISNDDDMTDGLHLLDNGIAINTDLVPVYAISPGVDGQVFVTSTGKAK